MRGRGRHEETDDVELLDVEPGSVVQADHLETASSNRMGAAIAAVIAIAAAVLVVGVGNSPSPPIAPPDAAIDEDPAEPERPLTEREQQEADFGVAIGEGPGLVWQRVETGSNARYWRWNDDSFKGDNGETEWSIALDDSGLTITERPSPLIEFPDYRLARLEGGDLLTPDVPQPDHLVVVVEGREPVRVEITSSTEPSPSGLTEANVWFYGAIIGDRLVVNRSNYLEIDIAELEARTQRDLTDVAHLSVENDQIVLFSSGSGPIPEPIPLTETDLTEEEVDELRTIGQPIGELLTADLLTGEVQNLDLADFEYLNDLLIGLDDELILGWTDQGGRSWLSTTVDGVKWSTERRAMARWLVNSGTQLFDFDSQGSMISRSIDGGESWDVTQVPLAETQRTVAGDVVVLGASWNQYGSSGVSVETGSDQLGLIVFENGQRFELRGPSPFGDPLLTGWTYDPASGAEWDWITNELVFTDPRTGEELLRVSGHALESAVAFENPMEQMALARWPSDVSNPEWLVTSPVDVFGEGSLRAEFTSGDQYVLAIITTVDSYELYITDTELR